MIIGLGSDIVDVRRIARVIERHGDRFIDRISTPAERAKAEGRANMVETYAKRFAAEELAPRRSAPVCGAACSGGIWAWSICRGAVHHEAYRWRVNRLHKITPAGNEARIDVSLTDEGPTAQAIVVISASPLAKSRCGPGQEL